VAALAIVAGAEVIVVSGGRFGQVPRARQWGLYARCGGLGWLG